MDEELPPPDTFATLLPFLLIIGGIVAVVVVIVLVVAFFQKKKKSATSSGTSADYLHRGSLLTQAESRLYEALVEAAKGDYWIFPKVRLAHIVKAGKSQGREAWQSAFDKISSKYIDFVLCIPGNYHIVAVIELDDGSQDRAERKEKEAFVDEVTASAGVPVLHIVAEESYDTEDLAQVIQELTSPPPTEESLSE
jgi:hypothetical protein